MRKIPKLRILSVLVVAVALVAALAVPVLAQPVTSPLSGSVTIDGDNAPVGTTVDVFVGAETTARATVTTTIAGYYEVMVTGQAADVGKDLRFEVDGLAAVSAPASPMFARYEPQVVDLAVGIGIVPPTVETLAATNIGETTARTWGELTDLGTATTVACYVDIGLTPIPDDDWWSTSVQHVVELHETDTFWISWVGLTPETTHYFRAVAEGDGTAYGSVVSFTTLEETEEPVPAGTFARWLYEQFIEPLEG